MANHKYPLIKIKTHYLQLNTNKLYMPTYISPTSSTSKHYINYKKAIQLHTVSFTTDNHT